MRPRHKALGIIGTIMIIGLISIVIFAFWSNSQSATRFPGIGVFIGEGDCYHFDSGSDIACAEWSWYENERDIWAEKRYQSVNMTGTYNGEIYSPQALAISIEFNRGDKNYLLMDKDKAPVNVYMVTNGDIKEWMEIALTDVAGNTTVDFEEDVLIHVGTFEPGDKGTAMFSLLFAEPSPDYPDDPPGYYHNDYTNDYTIEFELVASGYLIAEFSLNIEMWWC